MLNLNKELQVEITWVRNLNKDYIMETKGFYKNIEGTILYAPNFVSMPDAEILIELKDIYTYPVNNWYYFDTEDDAYLFFGVSKKVESIDNKDLPLF